MRIEIYTNGDSLYDAADTVNIVKMKMAEGYSQYEGTFGSRWFGYSVFPGTIKEPETVELKPFDATRREPTNIENP